MDRYVMKRLCEEARQEITSKSKEGAKFEWTPNAEVLFLYSMIGHKPVGVNRHFMMLLIHKKFSEYMNCEVSSEALWDHLNTMYNMSALNESETIPFPNEETDFELPEDCYEILLAKHGISLQRSNSESETNEASSSSSASSSKSSKKLTSRIKQSGRSVSTAKKQKDGKNSVQKKIGHENTTKKNESSSMNHGKAVVRSLSHSSKGQEMKTPSSSGDQYKGNETSRWLSVQLIDVLKNPLAEQDVDVFRFKRADEKLSNNAKSKLLDNETCAHVSSTSVGFDADSQNKKTEKQR